jgi:hypothetical protein
MEADTLAHENCIVGCAKVTLRQHCSISPQPTWAARNVRFGSILLKKSRHWLDYDPVALAVLVIGIGVIELVALII